MKGEALTYRFPDIIFKPKKRPGALFWKVMPKKLPWGAFSVGGVDFSEKPGRQIFSDVKNVPQAHFLHLQAFSVVKLGRRQHALTERSKTF